jgi:hypothetical protein
MDVIGRPRRSKMQANTVEKLGLKKSSFIALTVRFHMYLMSGAGRRVVAIVGERFQRISETA